MRFLHLIGIFLLTSFITPSLSYSEQTPPAEIQSLIPTADPVTMELHGEENAIQSGRPFWLLLKMNIQNDWHAYWKNPGDSGFPISIELNLPEGFKAGPIKWSSPEKLVNDSIIGYGYTKEAYFLVEITPPKNLDGKHTVEAIVKWLACSDQSCYPGESKANISLPVVNETPQVNTKTVSHFSTARELMPTKGWIVEGKRNGENIDLLITPQDNASLALTDGYFCAEGQDLLRHSEAKNFKKINGNPDQYLMSLTPKESASFDRVKGVLVAYNKENPNAKSHALDIDLVNDIAANRFIDAEVGPQSVKLVDPAQSNNSEWEGGLGLALLFAFLGGMILNLMPCVLPVISFKVLSFVKMAGQSRALTMKHGLAFFMGVLISFWVLAGVLLALQAYGRAVGWGFQLQEPIFVAILAAVLVVFGLSLFGVFEIGTVFASWAGQTASNKNKRNSGSGETVELVGSFFSGVLATAVATPCTGPFLGSAIGFAVTLPPILALLIFTFLGIGMAFPYLILAAFPSLLRVLPKPGPWMVVFKEIMGFLMLATVTWLIWVFGAETDHISTFLLLVGFLSLAFGCWIYGKWGSPIKKRRTRLLGSLLALLFFALGSVTIYTAAVKEPVDSVDNQVAVGGWEPFSPERIKELQAQGKPVLVDFTAKWCLICQTNHLVFILPEVSRKLDELGVVRMKADWTKNDPKITQALKEFGRNGVPLYVIYGKDASQQPAILPQVLTAEVVLGHLRNIEAQ